MSDGAQAFREAGRRIAESRRTGASSLSLQGLELPRLPDELWGLEELETLNLGSTGLPALSSEIGRLTQLKILDLSNNSLTDLPIDIVKLTNLRRLFLQWNFFSSVPLPVFKLYSLQELYLSRNRIEKLPAEISYLAALVWLQIDHNKLSTIAPEIEILPQLKVMDISHNAFSSFPIEVCRISVLQTLFIHHNMLRHIPDEISGLRSLRDLYAQDSRLIEVSKEIGKISQLRLLNLSRNQLCALPEEVGSLEALEELNVSFNRLTSLPRTLGKIKSLEKGSGGLLFEGNPLTYPYPALTWAGQPGTTYNVLAWLRGELDDEYPPEGPTPNLGDPPALPPQTLRPFVEIGNRGEISFVPPEEVDHEGNNIAQLRRIHPGLRAIAQELCSSMPSGNSQHPALQSRCEAYRVLIDRPMQEVDFGRLYLEGVRLEHAQERDNLEVASDVLAPLPPEADEALKSLLRVHGSFILATAAGVQGVAAEATYAQTPEERRIARDEKRALARSLAEAPNISAELREALQNAQEDNSDRFDPKRANVAETALLRNLSAAMIASAAIASPALVAYLVFGPAGTIIGGTAALPVLEALKKTKIFQRARGYLSNQIDRVTEEEAHQFLLRVREGRAVVERLERVFWRVAGRADFEWLSAWLDWLIPRDSPKKPDKDS